MPFDFDKAFPLIDDTAKVDELSTSHTTCWGPEGHEGDLHSQAWRKVTSSHLSPFDNRHYVVALPSFISGRVCSWIGDVKDVFVGVSDGGSEYSPITSHNSSLVSATLVGEEGEEGEEVPEKANSVPKTGPLYLPGRRKSPGATTPRKSPRLEERAKESPGKSPRKRRPRRLEVSDHHS